MATPAFPKGNIICCAQKDGEFYIPLKLVTVAFIIFLDACNVKK